MTRAPLESGQVGFGDGEASLDRVEELLTASLNVVFPETADGFEGLEGPRPPFRQGKEGFVSEDPKESPVQSFRDLLPPDEQLPEDCEPASVQLPSAPDA